jgi:hypothetical protein
VASFMEKGTSKIFAMVRAINVFPEMNIHEPMDTL